MERCFALARRGSPLAYPNPLVGSVVVHDGKILAEGFHERIGRPHAEAQALAALSSTEVLPKGTTLYVNLEPCCHFGKTPPCTKAIIERGIGRVVIATPDPNALVRGKGIAELRAHGVEVVSDVLFDEGFSLNRRFFISHLEDRPYIVLKWAETEDGYLARSDGSSKWISSDHARRLVHAWRAEEASILVGTQTALLDNPRLTTRAVSGSNPLRVIIDRQRRIPLSHAVFDAEAPTLLVTEEGAGAQRDPSMPKSVSIVTLPFDDTFVSKLLKELRNRNTVSILVEGGAALITSFLNEDLWDEARIVQSPTRFGAGLRAPSHPTTVPHTLALGEGETLLGFQNQHLLHASAQLKNFSEFKKHQ